MWSTFNTEGPNHISGTAKIVIRSCTRVDYIKYQSWDDKLSPNGHAQGHVTHLLKFADLSHIFGVGEVSSLVGRLKMVSTGTCVIVYPWMDVFRVHDLFTFWEIIHNVSEMVQDREIVTMETNRKSYVVYWMTPMPQTWSNNEGQLCCLRSF